MTSAEPVTGPDVAAGPLVVCEANPRYFSVASADGDDRTAVYLTGSHIWNNLHDGLGPGGSCTDVPEKNDYTDTTSSGCGAGSISSPRPREAPSTFV